MPTAFSETAPVHPVFVANILATRLLSSLSLDNEEGDDEDEEQEQVDWLIVEADTDEKECDTISARASKVGMETERLGTT